MERVAAHPEWCEPVGYCDARGVCGGHRSRRVRVEGPVPIDANLYAPAIAPGAVYVEIRCGHTFLPLRSALALGRVLVALRRVVSDGWDD